jgi:hypothetical protein
MAVLLLLILLDLAVMGVIIWAVVREPHRELKGNHQWVIADREAAAKLKSVEPAAPVAETTPTESETSQGA